MEWIVYARVSGGVTGTRESIVKDAAGAVKVFATKAEAQDEAARLTERMNHPFSQAYFQYWAGAR